MDKDKNGNLVFNRRKLTEDRCRQSKAQEMTISRNLLQDLLNDSAKLNRIRGLCGEIVDQIPTGNVHDLAEAINKIIREKL